jgi:hypothetical protein
MDDLSTRYLMGKSVLFKRRKYERNSCQKELFGEIFIPQTGELIGTKVLDLSEEGIGCTVSKPIEEKTNVYLHLKKRYEDSTFITISLAIAHCAAESEGSWRIGGKFREGITPLLMEYLLS